jgi:hypothetical protein
MPKGIRRTEVKNEPEESIPTGLPLDDLKYLTTPLGETEEIEVKSVTRAEFDELVANVNFVRETLADLVARVDKSAVKQSDTSTPAQSTGVAIRERESLSDIEIVVKEILGDDFESSVTSVPGGASFTLTITPPEHLRETPSDVRAKVISTVEGITGVRDYAEKVKKHIIGWAHKTGHVYTKES